MTTTNNTEKKITKRDRINELLAMAEVQANPGSVEYLTHELELLDKKNVNRKASSTAVNNAPLMDAIYKGMEADRLYTASEIIKEVPECGELSNQKVARLMNDMVKAGRLTKTTEKRKSVFQKVEGV